MTKQPRIGLIGAGAVGSLLAASLLHNTVPFKWVVRNPQRREALAHFTIQVDFKADTLAIPVGTVISTTGSLPPCDWTIIAVKAQQVAGVLAALPTHAAVRVLIAANGLQTAPHHLGLLYGGARWHHGILHITPDSKLFTGALPGARDAGPQLVPWLTSPWLRCGANEVIVKRMWHKLCLNCVINPLSALLDRPNGELLAWIDSPVINGVLAEGSKVAAAELGNLWSYSVTTLRKSLLQLIMATGSNSSSMREDIRAHRETEISCMNLAVARIGVARNIPCPLTRALGIMIEAITNSNQA